MGEYLNDGENIIFHITRFPEGFPPGNTDVSVCSASLLYDHDWNITQFFSCTFSVVFLKKKKKKIFQISSTRFLLDILLSLAYLKIVIKEKENCHRHLCGQVWRRYGQSECCLKPLKRPPFHSYSHASVRLCCLTFCSTCSNCGASWTVLLTLRALRYLSRVIRDLQTVSEPDTREASSVSWASQRSFYLCDIVFFCASW